MKKIVLGMALLAVSAIADTISLRADIWCPYNCEPSSDKPGFMIEIAKEVFGKAGHTVDYQLLPWSRALRQTEDGTYTGVVGAAAGDVKGFILPGIEQGVAGNAFFIRSDDTWKYEGVASLEKVALGIIRDYTYGGEIDKYLENAKDKQSKVQIASGEYALDTNFKKLLANRIDVVIENKYVGLLKLKELGMQDKVKIVTGEDTVEPVYIAFSPKNPKSKEYAEVLSKGTEELRKSGKLKEILAKYGVEDWKK